VEQFKNLFSPFSTRDVELRNRVLITGHMTSFPSDGMPTDAQASYFAERAKGGVGLIVLAWCVVHKNGWVIRTAEAGARQLDGYSVPGQSRDAEEGGAGRY
jgi:2,4-dienoyl-CoA reductase-like NADH-dependent reductase (Old Yellow Enzyme family)